MHLSKRVGNYQWSRVRHAQQGKGAKAAHNWKVLSLGSGRTQKPAQVFADGIGFAFGTTPNPGLFLTNHTGSGLLGDLTGKTLTATFTITGTAPRSRPGDGPPEERLRHARIGAPLLRGQPRPTTRAASKAMVVDPAGVHPDEPGRPYPHVDGSARHGELADRGFQLASDVPTDFAAAVAKVGAVGVSFGGGCFLPTGAFPTDGTASFVLKSYSVS